MTILRIMMQEIVTENNNTRVKENAQEEERDSSTSTENLNQK